MTPPRRLAVTLVALAVAALGLWVATRLVWLRQTFQSPLRGEIGTQTTGAEVRPELVAVAVLALAAVAALVATGGWARRLLGFVLVLAGAWAAWQSASSLANESTGWFAYVPSDAVPAGPPVATAAPLLALGASAVLVAAGVLTVWWATAMPRMGARYSAPGAAARRRDRDTEWWEALDAGEDPTQEGPGTDPGRPR
ncbi:Trp biosynthesis-associated membrane protein [Pseudonocardia acaciae]|uniref:Trp biosynthesis-associated membrane protein n=1 Tax=Pseudonocardia acaciae TaxID=551276 RepID=UPI00048B7F47|nr:Trp biosynthesis-associated membrane protein [Pseudonocardia acaciae]